MIKRRILELLLEHVSVPHRGHPVPGESRHVLSVALVWPRMAIAHKTATRAVTFTDGVYRPDADSWTQRILFKEAVEGPFGIRVEVSEAMTATQWSEALARLGSAAWTLAGTHVLDLVEGPATSILWKAPFDALARTATAAVKNDPRPVAVAFMDLQCEKWAADREQRLSLAMTAPDDLVRVTRKRVAGKWQSRRSVAVRANQANGEAVLLARVYA